MLSKILLASVAIILSLSSNVNAEYNVVQYCQLVPVGTKFPSLDNCRNYYTCQSTALVTQSSCASNQVFNKDLQSCIPATADNCNINLDNPCQNKNGVWVPDNKDCRIWHYCQNNKILGSGSCGIGQIFDFNSQKCINGQCSSNGNGGNNGNNNGGVYNQCDIMQNGQFFGDFANCKAWHKCSGSIMKSGTCNSGLIYDSQQRMCLPSQGNTCGGPTETCDAANNGAKVADSKICSNYYLCTKQGNDWVWQKNQCNNNNYFNPATKSCLGRQAATPAATCDRCQYSSAQWVNAVDANCQKYLICKNGVEIQSGTCKTGYFNEQRQSCVEGSSLESYSQLNGACATASETTPETPTETTEKVTEKPTEESTTKPPASEPTTKPPATKPTTEKPETEKPETESPATEPTTKPETEPANPPADGSENKA